MQTTFLFVIFLSFSSVHLNVRCWKRDIFSGNGRVRKKIILRTAGEQRVNLEREWGAGHIHEEYNLVGAGLKSWFT